MKNYDFEVGPIRPPSEARSLLLRVTRNCPWNRCAFCLTYKGQRFARRQLEEILSDLSNIKAIADEIRSLAWQMGQAGRITGAVANRAYQLGGEKYYHVARWLYYGGSTVFLQDADCLMTSLPQLEQVLIKLKETFPMIQRITGYTRASTLARRDVKELQALNRAGLTRLHVGLESGAAEVLTYMDKGVTPQDAVAAGEKARQARIELCFYVILGLGGQRWREEHVRETARVINAARPRFVRFRTLTVLPGTPLAQRYATGDFPLLSEDEIIFDLRRLLLLLDDEPRYIASDHAMNLLEGVEGNWPEDKAKMLQVIDGYLNLPPAMRLHFRLGRRAGYYRYLEDMADLSRRQMVEKMAAGLSTTELEEAIAAMQRMYL